jgi:hypothetical protein
MGGTEVTRKCRRSNLKNIAQERSCGNAGEATSFVFPTIERHAEKERMIQAQMDQIKDGKRK